MRKSWGHPSKRDTRNYDKRLRTGGATVHVVAHYVLETKQNARVVTSLTRTPSAREISSRQHPCPAHGLFYPCGTPPDQGKKRTHRQQDTAFQQAKNPRRTQLAHSPPPPSQPTHPKPFEGSNRQCSVNPGMPRGQQSAYGLGRAKCPQTASSPLSH